MFVCVYVCAQLLLLMTVGVLDYPQFTIHKICKIKVELGTLSDEISPTVKILRFVATYNYELNHIV